MTFRPDMLSSDSPEGLEIIQLTTEKDVHSSHVYMEAQIFTPDSKRFIFHRSANAHGSDQNDPEHRYLLCDIEDNCRLTPITEEIGATAPSISPDGRFLYYFVNETKINSGRLTLKRVGLDGSGRQTILVVDTPLPHSSFRPSHIYPLSTISSDGKRLALSAFFGDRQTKEPWWSGAPWGVMVFNLEEASVNLMIHGPTWYNAHPQYSRSLNPEAKHDILIQENHPGFRGKPTSMGGGADIHVIREDGTNFRTMPWGRDTNEYCQGHQCWRGRSDWAITSIMTRKPWVSQLIEGQAATDAGHLGLKTSGAVRNDLSREYSNPHFAHFATDIEGRRLITDAGPFDQGGCIFLAELGEPGKEPLKNLRLLLKLRRPPVKVNKAHIHPFLSPDGTMGFFNSDESGILQAYMIRGLPM